MEDNPEYNINDDIGDTNLLKKEEDLKGKKKIIIILTIIIVALSMIIIAGIILYFTLGQKDNNNQENKENKENEENKENKIPQYSLFINISTSENKTIRNSFKKNCENYNENIGDLNNGTDYEENERDNVDLCIPSNAAKNKSNYKTIFLVIHGGGWVGGEKVDALGVCKVFSTYEFLVATMSYTLLNGQYKDYN